MDKPANETDSLPRIQVRDMFMLLRLFDGTDETTLENFRLRLCTDRQTQRRGDYLFSTARDTAAEIQRLGLLEGGPFPKDGRDYARMRNNALRITKQGRDLMRVFSADRGTAYDKLFALMYAAHRHLRDYVAVLAARHVFAPILTSMKDHISPAYANAVALAEDLSRGEFRMDDMIAGLTQRLKRPLSEGEVKEIGEGVRALMAETRLSAASEDATEFAKKVIEKLNSLVVPAVLREAGLHCDFRTHRAAWSIGQEFLAWCATTSHLEYPGTLVFRTATIVASHDGARLETLRFEARSADLETVFLPRLWNAYTRLQKAGAPTFVPAWELRAAFCFENSCQPSVFNNLFSQQYTRGDGYELHMEIQRQLPRSETPLRAGARNIGSVRVAKK
jgi:hypothetical protein